MKLIVIHNSDAGSGDWSSKRVRALLHEAGHQAEIISGDDQWRDVLSEQPDAFVAAGGDGTVHDVLHALVGRTVPVAILPLGTANNVAHALGYRTAHDLLDRVRHWQDYEQSLHVGSVQAGGYQQPFVESVGVGAFARARKARDGKAKESAAALGLLAMRRKLIKKLLSTKPVEVSFRIDDQSVQGEYLLAECLALPFCGARLRLAPEEKPHDALLTVSAVPASAREAAAQWMATGVGDTRNWVVGRGCNVELRVDDWSHVDGEIWPPKRKRTGLLEIQAAASTMRVMV